MSNRVATRNGGYLVSPEFAQAVFDVLRRQGVTESLLPNDFLETSPANRTIARTQTRRERRHDKRS